MMCLAYANSICASKSANLVRAMVRPEGGPGDGGGVLTFSGSGVGGLTTGGAGAGVGVVTLEGVDGEGRGGGFAASVAYEEITLVAAGVGFLQSFPLGESGALSSLSRRLQFGPEVDAKSEY